MADLPLAGLTPSAPLQSSNGIGQDAPIYFSWPDPSKRSNRLRLLRIVLIVWSVEKDWGQNPNAPTY
jgi:hypothetical protein